MMDDGVDDPSGPVQSWFYGSYPIPSTLQYSSDLVNVLCSPEQMFLWSFQLQ